MNIFWYSGPCELVQIHSRIANVLLHLYWWGRLRQLKQKSSLSTPAPLVALSPHDTPAARYSFPRSCNGLPVATHASYPRSRKGPASKHVKLQPIPKRENTRTNLHSPWRNSFDEGSNQEADKLVPSCHSWRVPRGAHPVVSKVSRCSRGHRGSLVTPYVWHEKKGRHSDEKEGA